MIGETILIIGFSIVVLIFVVAIMKMFVQSILEKELVEFLFSSLAMISVVGIVLILLGI
ncbi:hypothetical protein [Staphylococcus equorum]|uniref:hypothetical protein n=1 Tax=Staphylococcus equorum TaxID=246432 RepID=UPI00359414FE